MQPSHPILTGIVSVTLMACAGAPMLAASDAMRQVDGDVAVLALVVRGEEAAASVAVADALRAEVAERLGPRARTAAAIREAISAQLEGANLLPAHRGALLVAVAAVDADPVRGLGVLRAHRAATVADDELRGQARALFLRAATEALGRGERAGARALLAELHGWLGDTTPKPGALEVPQRVQALWREVHARPGDFALYRHTLPFLTLLPDGLGHLALATTATEQLAPDVVEQATRLGTALRLDKVILAGVVGGRPRAWVIDVSTRALERDLALWSPPDGPRRLTAAAP